MMAQIYESAFVTLAATKAPDAESGCFSTPDPKYRSRTMTLAAKEGDWGGATMEVHSRVELPHGVLGGNPLFSRAWVGYSMIKFCKAVD
jgi:hypothetical protein